MEVPVFTRFYLLNDRRNKVKRKRFLAIFFPFVFFLFFFFSFTVDLQIDEILFKSRSRWDSIICKISVKY